MTMSTDVSAPPGSEPESPPRRPRGFRALVFITLGSSAMILAVGFGGATARAAAPTVQVGADTTFGSILTTGAGMALYTLNTDHNGQSTCHGACAAAWPALTVAAGATPTAGPGVTGAVGTAEQTNGTFQVTYNGAPLYTFVSDTAPGDVTGNNVAGFSVVTVSSPPTTTAPPAPPAGSGTTAPTNAASPTAAQGTTGTGGPGPTASSSSAAAAAPGGLAFTGVGDGLWGLFLVGLALSTLGALLSLGRRRHLWLGRSRGCGADISTH